ncbi:MAG: response regulator [Rhodobacteraceae bacterium]|nr:MAG: response regulator [Paracoccaceae bacterium]
MPKTVLIVEDDELNLRFFDELLSSEGYRTLTATTGADALAAARGERPDLVLLDIELPEGSGLDVAGAMKRDVTLAGVPVIAVTAHAMEGDEARIRDGGCEGYIAKPVTMRGFLDTVRRYAHA